jgi:hypothetical protein
MSFRGNRQKTFVTAARDQRLVRANTMNWNMPLHMPDFLTVRGCSSERYLFFSHTIFIEASKRNRMVIIFQLRLKKTTMSYSRWIHSNKVFRFSPTSFLQYITSCLTYSAFGLWRFTLKRNRPLFGYKKESVELFFEVLSPTTFIIWSRGQ